MSKSDAVKNEQEKPEEKSVCGKKGCRPLSDEELKEVTGGLKTRDSKKVVS